MTSEAARQRFSEAVLPHLGDAFALARWLTGNAADAEDVVQDACVRALRALDAGPVTLPRPWLMTIVRNTAFSWLAKNRPKDVVCAGDAAADELVAATPTPEEALIGAADGAAVAAAIAALPMAFREVLVLREINELSYRDIAEATGTPVGTVMSRLARARALLAVRLGGPP